VQGDEGPYMNDSGDVWVPRTVPYLRARQVAKSGPEIDSWCKLVYVGKSDAELLGFSRDCRCDEVCEAFHTDDGETDDDRCRVPAWHFRIEER